MLDNAVRTLYGYDRWATGRILDSVARIPEEQFVAPAPVDQRSIRDTLVHMVAAQRRWLSWWDGSLPAAEAQRLTLAPADFRNVASVRAAYEETAEHAQAFAAGLTDADLARSFDAGQWSEPLWLLMLHVANHGTQHRSEVAAMVTALGQSPGDLDLTVYYASGRR